MLSATAAAAARRRALLLPPAPIAGRAPRARSRRRPLPSAAPPPARSAAPSGLLRPLSGSAAPAPVASSSSYGLRPFDKVLIANRGEIACRVIRACSALGVRTVAVYSDADGPDSLHASMADESYMIGIGPSPKESYLRGEEVIEIALASGAQAIHPGYGFLSENGAFASLTSERGLTFVGPGPDAILAMGSKSRSKEIMDGAGVPTTPGYNGAGPGGQDAGRLLHEAVNTVGFPLLVKATMGGGGKGMRLVRSEGEFLPALESCRRESAASFGDDRVILERYLVDPRHVEVQVVADSHGNAVHLYERDCSLQRRHQKIIEEAPASDLGTDVRSRMGDMAVRAAMAVGYVNAGTVEFLFDTKSGGDGDGFYFCEMNTRLQVEHPVTELITGIDLVEWQLRIAAGEELPIKDQDDIPRARGHAMEARIYAENPARDFLPATGRVWHHRPPVPPNVGEVGGVRVDTGVRVGKDITVHYDPMIGKLIATGPDRTSALDGLIRSLERYEIAGVPTNVPFLIACASHPAFAEAGGVDTGFLDRHADEVRAGTAAAAHPGPLERASAALGALLLLEDRAGVPASDLSAARRAGGCAGGGPWGRLSGSWRMGGRGGRLRRVLTPLADDGDDDGGGDVSSRAIECLSNPDGSFDVALKHPPTCGDGPPDADGVEFNLAGRLDRDGRMDVTVDGTRRLSLNVATREDIDGGTIEICLWSAAAGGSGGGGGDTARAWRMTFRHPLPAGSSPSSGAGPPPGAAAGALVVRAPMPGKIVRVNAAEGDAVRAGDVILVMEAMKMEHTVSAPGGGILSSVGCDVGDIVNDGEILAVVRDERGDCPEGGGFDGTV